MKSYAVVDRIEGKYAVCEVELVEVEESPKIDFLEKVTDMIDVPLEKITSVVGEVKERDVLIVEHEDERVTKIYSKDEEEKQRRIKIIRKIIETI